MGRSIRAYSSARWALAAAALVGAAACGDTEFNTVVPVAAAITVSSATNNQTAIVGQALAQPVVVQVTDGGGAPIGNVVVTWTVLSGGGSVSTTTSTTDLNGNASVIWTLGPVAGANTLQASIATGATATISATGVASGAAGMTIVSGNNQTIAIGATSAPLAIHISDPSGNPVAGAVVNWTASAGAVLSSAQTTTDANGNTFITMSAGAAMVATVTATSGALAPASFTVTVQ